MGDDRQDAARIAASCRDGPPEASLFLLLFAANYQPSTPGSPHKTWRTVDMQERITAKRTAKQQRSNSERKHPLPGTTLFRKGVRSSALQLPPKNEW
jgi:hypothetical protein